MLKKTQTKVVGTCTATAMTSCPARLGTKAPSNAPHSHLWLNRQSGDDVPPALVKANHRESSACVMWQLKLDFYFLPDIPFDFLWQFHLTCYINSEAVQNLRNIFFYFVHSNIYRKGNRTTTIVTYGKKTNVYCDSSQSLEENMAAQLASFVGRRILKENVNNAFGQEVCIIGTGLTP